MSAEEAAFNDFSKRTPSFEGDLNVGVELDIFVNTFGVDVLRNGGLLFTAYCEVSQRHTNVLSSLRKRGS